MPPPTATQAAARLWTARPELHTKLAECMTPPAGSVRRFTRGHVRELKNGHNSVTVQNRTHVYMNFFQHKDLGNHLLQLCPKVVKHPVFHFIQKLCVVKRSLTNRSCDHFRLYSLPCQAVDVILNSREQKWKYIWKMYVCAEPVEDCSEVLSVVPVGSFSFGPEIPRILCNQKVH